MLVFFIKFYTQWRFFNNVNDPALRSYGGTQATDVTNIQNSDQ